MKWAKLKSTAATVASLRIVCTFFISMLLASGCSQKNEAPTFDDDTRTFPQKINEAPVNLLSKEELPEWLQAKLDFLTPDIPQPLKFFRGVWNQNVVYYLVYLNNCAMCEIYYESGEKINWAVQDGHNYEKFCSESKDWVLIYRVGDSENF